MALTLTLNGASRCFENLGSGASLVDLIEVLELKGDRVALELNGEIAPRTAWGVQLLQDSDRIELVHFVGGGAESYCSASIMCK